MQQEEEGDDRMKKPRIQRMDMLSNLTDPIVHHIMSFLPISDVTKLSILSKRLFFLWGSFPVLDLDQERFSRTNQGKRSSTTSGFLDHVLNTVMIRTTDMALSEFRVNVNLKGILADSKFDKAILIALANGVKCMELNNLGSNRYRLPMDFASRTINVLRLKGFQLNLCNLIQVCPLLKTVCLTSCLILQDIMFSSETLTEIEVNFCDVRSIKINAPNLRMFTFHSSSMNPKRCTIDVLQCPNIIYFSLNNVVNGRNWIEHHVNTLSKLKTFILDGCRDIEHISVRNDNLERVELTDCLVLTSIELKTISLESFLYKSVRYYYTVCDITFLTSKRIKDLSITGGDLITDQWLETHLTKMTHLQKLRLQDCKSLKSIKVSHKTIQVLELSSCDGLVEAEIDTPQLVSFAYHGKVIEIGKMVTHGNCNATLSMNPWINYDNASFFNWSKMLSFFGHFKALKLICNTHKELMIPELHKERLVSPLYDLQHFEIQIYSLKKIDIDLVESLLWLSPLPKTLHVSSVSSSKMHMILKFVYSDMIEGEEDKNPFCCETKPIKCWKHHLKRLEIQNSDVSPNESIELQKYFLKNSKKSDSFCINKLLV